MYGFDLWIKIAHLLFYLYSSGQFWQLEFSFIDQGSHCAHEGLAHTARCTQETMSFDSMTESDWES